jgi:hypothetical protein
MVAPARGCLQRDGWVPTLIWMSGQLAEAGSDPRRINIDPTNPNRIYWAGNIPGRMGFIEVLPQ